MGNRAVVVFHDGKEFSPCVYLHWGGSEVPTLLAELWALMAGRRGDLSYSAARFIGVAHAKIPGNLSLGIWNSPVSEPPGDLPKQWREHSHGDAGVFVVDCRSGDVVRVGGYEDTLPEA